MAAVQTQGQATPRRDVSTLAPLRALRARTSDPAWTRLLVGEGVRSCPRWHAADAIPLRLFLPPSIPGLCAHSFRDPPAAERCDWYAGPCRRACTARRRAAPGRPSSSARRAADARRTTTRQRRRQAGTV